MKILHVTPTYVPRIGGIENVVHNLARHGRRAGLEVDVVEAAAGLGSADATDADGIRVRRLPLVGHRLAGFVPGLRRIAADYDVIHVHDPQVGALTQTLLGAGPPAVLSTHGGFHHTARAAAVKRLHAAVTVPLLLRRYDRILCSSRPDLAAFARYGDRVVLVENGVDATGLATAGATARDMTRWVSWGRFSRNKRLDVLIDRVAASRAAGLDIRLTICGTDFDGLLPAMRTQIAALGLTDRVTIEVEPDRARLRAIAAGAGVYATASEYEGFGLSVVEAMGAGLVPLVRAIAPLDALVGEAGLVLKFADTVADIAAIRALVTADPARLAALRAAGLGQAMAFDWSRSIGRFVMQYRAVAR